MTDYSVAPETEVEVVEGHEFVIIPTRGHRPYIEWQYPEFQCLCPVSGRHDHGTLTIKYVPKDGILESKSVREYLAKWRNKRIWQEYVTEEIARTLYEACKPEYLVVEIEWAPRGGIYSKTRAVMGQEKQ